MEIKTEIKSKIKEEPPQIIEEPLEILEIADFYFFR